MFIMEKETKKIMMSFKTIKNKQQIADILAYQTVDKGRKEKSKILFKYYMNDEPDFVTISCISFGLINLMEEDFYIIKEVLGYEYIINFLDEQDKFLQSL